MSENLSADKNINADNLTALYQKASVLSERRILELHDIATSTAEVIFEMLSQDYGIYEALSFAAEELLFGESTPHESFMPENAALIRSYLDLNGAFDKCAFAKLLVEALADKGVYLKEESFFESFVREENIAFVKNQLASEAYDVFAVGFKNPHLKYAKDLRYAVKMLVNGEVGYCILPLEEEGGVRLSSVSEILFRDDLKISSVTPVFGVLGNADMKYALVSKAVDVPEIEDGDDRYLEIRIKKDDGGTFKDLIAASGAFGVEIYRINTISFKTEDGDVPYYSLVFKKDAGDFLLMLLYLTLFVEDFTPIGIYKNLE